MSVASLSGRWRSTGVPRAPASASAGSEMESRSPTSRSTSRPSASAWSSPESAAMTIRSAGRWATTRRSIPPPPMTMTAVRATALPSAGITQIRFAGRWRRPPSQPGGPPSSPLSSTDGTPRRLVSVNAASAPITTAMPMACTPVPSHRGQEGPQGGQRRVADLQDGDGRDRHVGLRPGQQAVAHRAREDGQQHDVLPARGRHLPELPADGGDRDEDDAASTATVVMNSVVPSTARARRAESR